MTSPDDAEDRGTLAGGCLIAFASAMLTGVMLVHQRFIRMGLAQRFRQDRPRLGDQARIFAVHPVSFPRVACGGGVDDDRLPPLHDFVSVARASKIRAR